MDDNIVFGIGAIIALIFVLWLFVKILKGIRPMTKKELIQHEINKRAAGTDEERYRALGKSARAATKKGGWRGWFWFLIILGIIALLIFAALSKS